MPFNPAGLGDEMIVAGQKQKSTGAKLTKAAGQLREFSNVLKAGEQLDTSLGSIRTGVGSTRTLLGPVVSALQFIVNTLNGVRIPTITAQTRRINFAVIGRVRFVTGINIGSTRPFTNMAARVNTVRTNIVNIRAALNAIANGLRDVRKELPQVRSNVLNAAKEMDSGATDLIAAGDAMEVAGAQLGGTSP
jgi:hypothetical protein